MFYTGTGALLGCDRIMLIAVIPLIFAIIGILMWVLATNPVLKEAGRLIFFAAFLALMFAFSRQTLTIG